MPSCVQRPSNDYSFLRMLRLQDVKVGLAEAALGEGTGAKLHKLSVKDIKYVSLYSDCSNERKAD